MSEHGEEGERRGRMIEWVRVWWSDVSVLGVSSQLGMI